MRRAVLWCACTMWMIVFGDHALIAQIAPSPAPSSAPAAPAVTGGRLHGVVKSGNIPLPGVTVTAQNTLTGRKFSTTTDITGAWSMNVPQNGRYVIRTQFAAFAPGAQEALLNSTTHDQAANFQLVLASRAAAAGEQQSDASSQQSAQAAIQQAIQQLGGNGVQSLSLMNALASDTETGLGAAGVSGAELPSAAANTDVSSESVSISGQSGQVSPLAGMDLDRIRDAIESYRAANPGQALPGSGGLFGGGPGGFGGGGFGGGGFGPGGGFGGPMMGGGRGGRGNFRGFNPGQPHGAIAWYGTNSALNALPFSLTGQQQEQPANGTNRFTISFMSAPYIPHLTKPSGKDTVFLTLSGQRSSTPDDFYATVPTLAERSGDFSASDLPAIYDPTTLQRFIYNGTANVIPPNRIAPQAAALLSYYPQPNLSGASVVNGYNYHFLTTAQSNSTQAGIRYMRSLGKNATMGGFGGPGGGFRGGRRGSSSQGLRQSINANYNWSHSASDSVNIFPELGGKSASDSYSLQAGYTVGYHRLTNIFNVNWNRSSSNATNFFTNTASNPALAAGITVPNNIPLNYGLPTVSLSNLEGLSETQPSFSISQTISASEVVSWRHGQHNLRFGGDYRRVHRDFLAGSNATGTFAFTGLFTEDAAGDAATGTSFADFLLGLPQSTTLNSAVAKSYLRDNVFDAYAMDDWRILSSLTLNYGVRWDFYAPYVEKYGHMAGIETSSSNGFASQTEVTQGTAGYPHALVNPYHKAFSPRVSLAWRVPKVKQTVVRAGFGMNYTVGEYGSFANLFAHQPPFTNEQTNTAAVNGKASSACAQTSSCFTLENGFTTQGATVGNYAVDPNYGLPYVMAWNLDVQKTLPLGLMMNLGYNGSRANHLDVQIAPRSLPNSPGTNPTNLQFTYDQAEAFYKMNAATVRLNKRLGKGIAMGANYQYMHAIDDASAVNGSSGGSVAQNWENVAAETGHSGQDVRHRVTGTYLFELPFGPDKYWITTGVPAHILEGFSVSGDFTFSTGSWLSPVYTLSTTNVECGTTGSLRPNMVAGQAIAAGGGSKSRWFNTAAFTSPSSPTTIGNVTYCNSFGSAPRNSIVGPGKVLNDMALSKTANLGDTRSFEIRATMSNVFNTVQYSGVNTTYGTPTFGQVTSAGQMREFQFTARFRF